MDTTFIERVIFDTAYEGVPNHFYHAVFIEKNRHSKFYDAISDFSFTSTENLDEYNKSFREKGIKLPKINTAGLAAEWVPLYQYKNKYYVYSPSEVGLRNRRILSDSLLICWYIDGPYPYVLNSVKKTGKYTYSITTKEYFNNEDVFAKPVILNIYIVDEKNKIAVWEYKTAKDPHFYYRLFIPKESIKNFDLVVNYCQTDKQMEFDFDEPDFPALLKKIPVK